MKIYNGTLLIALITILSVLLGITQATSGTSTSYLQPEEGFFGFTMLNPYYQAISERLLSSSQNRKCQAVFLPSFSQESAVYLKYDNENPTASPIVVSLKFEKQLWAEMHKLMAATADTKMTYSTGAEAQQKVLPQIYSMVNRLEAPIDKKVAVALELVWNTMLARTHYTEKVEHGLDGEGYHFANFIPEIGYRTGKVWSPDKGTFSYELVEIAKALREYPGLREVDRKDAANALLNRAQNLLSRLNKK